MKHSDGPIRPVPWLCGLIILFVATPLLTSHADAQFVVPPEIRRIQEKLGQGLDLTEEEEAALDKWEEELDLREDFDEPEVPSPNKQPAPVPVSGLPSAAPSRGAYLKVVREAASIYGEKAGPVRKDIDCVIAKAKTSATGSDLGALLLLAGGGSASIYATAQTALADPDDYLAASNLGWALCVFRCGRPGFPRSTHDTATVSGRGRGSGRANR